MLLSGLHPSLPTGQIRIQKLREKSTRNNTQYIELKKAVYPHPYPQSPCGTSDVPHGGVHGDIHREDTLLQYIVTVGTAHKQQR